jgi:hypothetical protein
MNTSQVRTATLVAMVLCLSIPWLMAGDEPKPGTPSRRESKGKPGGEKPADSAKAVPHLGRTIQLEFKLVGDEERTFPVLCAIGEFSIHHQVKEPNGEHALLLDGELRSIETPSRILLRYKAAVRHANSNEGVAATFTTSGSGILEMNKEKMLARLGEATLKVTARVKD